MIVTLTLNPAIDSLLTVERLSVGDANRVIKSERDAGGKGVNVARVAREMGAEVLATGFLGSGLSAVLIQVLNEEGVPCDFVRVHEPLRVNVCVESLAGGPPTSFNEPGPHISDHAMKELPERIEALLRRFPGAWLAMCGSLPPGVPKDVYRIIGELARSLGAHTVLDADGDALKFGLESRPNLIKPNEREAERLLGHPVSGLEGALAAARELRATLADETIVVVSSGAEGAAMTWSEGECAIAAPKVDAISTLGSGDSLIAGMLSAFERGEGPREALKWGIAAGAATAMTGGKDIAQWPDIERLYDSI